MRSRTTKSVAPPLALALAWALALVLSGCASGPGSTDPTPSLPPNPGATVAAAPDFAPATPPPPAGTFTPSPSSWAGTNPEPGYRVVLLTTEQNPRTRVLSDAVRSWARDTQAELSVIDASHPHEYVARVQAAVDERCDLVIATGDGLVDPLALVTASNLDQQFLVVGAELAEPTLNVTAADWNGASYRGEGLGKPATFDPSTFTPERADRAVRAGVAAVLTGLNGTVVWVD